jgi:hypothetical protein
MDGMRIILDTRGRLMEFNDEKEETEGTGTIDD